MCGRVIQSSGPLRLAIVEGFESAVSTLAMSSDGTMLRQAKGC